MKALLWWALLVPAGAVVFFSAAERVHDAKAGAEAERGALRGAAARASVVLLKWPTASLRATPPPLPPTPLPRTPTPSEAGRFKEFHFPPDEEADGSWPVHA